MLNRLKALTLLSECTGDDIWSVEHCQQRGIPPEWIEELADCYESGYDRNSQTIYYQIAWSINITVCAMWTLRLKLGEFLGIDVEELIALAPSRARLVLAIRQAIEDM